jgi:hypothetical protein
MKRMSETVILLGIKFGILLEDEEEDSIEQNIRM